MLPHAEGGEHSADLVVDSHFFDAFLQRSLGRDHGLVEFEPAARGIHLLTTELLAKVRVVFGEPHLRAHVVLSWGAVLVSAVGGGLRSDFNLK